MAYKPARKQNYRVFFFLLPTIQNFLKESQMGPFEYEKSFKGRGDLIISYLG